MPISNPFPQSNIPTPPLEPPDAPFPQHPIATPPLEGKAAAPPLMPKNVFALPHFGVPTPQPGRVAPPPPPPPRRMPNQPPSRLAVARSPHHGDFLGALEHAGSFALGILGTSPGYLKAIAEHPLAKLEGHGQFAVGGKYGPKVSSTPRPGFMKVGPHRYVEVQGAQDVIQFGGNSALKKILEGEIGVGAAKTAARLKLVPTLTQKALSPEHEAALGRLKQAVVDLHNAKGKVSSKAMAAARLEVKAAKQAEIAARSPHVGVPEIGRRTPEQAAAHVFKAAQQAIQEGHGPVEGGGFGQAPIVKAGEPSPHGISPEVDVAVRNALSGKGAFENMGPYEKAGAQLDNPMLGKSAAEARNIQEAGYHEARVQKVAAAEAAYQRGDMAGANKALQGALPKVDFQGFRSLDRTTVAAMQEHIMQSPILRTFEKKRLLDSLDAALTGKVPTASDQKLWERVFGRELTSQMAAASKEINKWPKVIQDLMNVPRSIMASFDLSAPLRQGLVAGVSHPVIFAKAFAPMLKAARTEKFFQQMIQDEIHARPTFPLMEKAGVAFTDIGKTAGHGEAAAAQREEQFMSNYAERIPGFGKVIRASDRAYVGFLNRIRADVFDHLLQEAAQQGHDVNNEKFLKSVARFVNSSTGRGSLGALNSHTATLNALFFSPRLLASRINFLNPVWYFTLDPFARREAMKAFLALGTMAGTILTLAKMGGAKVNLDPTNADFAKVKVGNTRIDLLGGFQQPIRLAAQLAENKITSSTTGNVIPLGSGIAKTSRFDVLMKFLEGKFSPVPALVVTVLKGQTYTGQAVHWNQLSTYERQLGQNMVPFLAQDMYDTTTTSGPGAAAATFPLDLFGVGVQTYKGKTPKSSSSSYGGSSGYGGSSSAGYGSGVGYGSSGGVGYGG